MLHAPAASPTAAVAAATDGTRIEMARAGMYAACTPGEKAGTSALYTNACEPPSGICAHINSPTQPARQHTTIGNRTANDLRN